MKILNDVWHAQAHKPSNHDSMKFTFAEDGEVIKVDKVPFENIIQVKTLGKIFLYERTADGVKKANETTDPREPIIVKMVTQYFTSTGKHNRYRTKY